MMDRDSIESRAANICERIKRVGPLAVFNISGKIRTARADKELSDKMFEQNLRSVVGVYDERATETMIAEDIAYVLGVRE